MDSNLALKLPKVLSIVALVFSVVAVSLTVYSLYRKPVPLGTTRPGSSSASSIATQLSSLQNDVESLKNRTGVMFAANASPNGNLLTVPDQKLLLKNVLFNVGNAYNPDSGTFTAPQAGIYYFWLNLFQNSNAGTWQGRVYLTKNDVPWGEPVLVAGDTNLESTTRYGALTIQLKKDDRISLVAKYGVFKYFGFHTTWGGHLLY